MRLANITTRRLSKLNLSAKRRYTDAIDLPKLQPRIVLDEIIPHDRTTFTSYHIRGPFSYDTQEETPALLAEYRSLIEAPKEGYQYVHPAKASRIFYVAGELQLRSLHSECITLFKMARTEWNLIPTNDSSEYALAAASELSDSIYAEVANLVVADIMRGQIMPHLWLLNGAFTALYRTGQYEYAVELWNFYQENLGPENKENPEGRKYFVVYASTVSALMQTAWRLRDSVFGASVFRFARKYNVPLSVLVWRRYLRLLYEDERYEDILDEWPAVRPLVASREFPETDARAFLISARRLRKTEVAEDVFALLKATIPNLSWFTYSAMVAVYARTGQIEQVHKCLELMREQELPIGSAPYTTLLSHYAEVNDSTKFKEVWQTMLRDPSTELDPTTAAVALRLFRKQKEFASCEQIFDILLRNITFSNPSPNGLPQIFL